MERLKCKAKSSLTDEWCYGYVEKEDSQYVIINGQECYKNTLCTCAGIKDINGVCIFEHDILNIYADVGLPESDEYEADITEREYQLAVAESYFGFNRSELTWIDKYACYGFVEDLPAEEIEGEIDAIMGDKDMTAEDYSDWYENYGQIIMDLCHLLRPKFGAPAVKLEVIGNKYDD